MAPVLIAARLLWSFWPRRTNALLLRKMRWTILMSTGDCFQAAYSVELKLAGESDDE
jgi:hypothetical protein